MILHAPVSTSTHADIQNSHLRLPVRARNESSTVPALHSSSQAPAARFPVVLKPPATSLHSRPAPCSFQLHHSFHRISFFHHTTARSEASHLQESGSGGASSLPTLELKRQDRQCRGCGLPSTYLMRHHSGQMMSFPLVMSDEDPCEPGTEQTVRNIRQAP